MSAFFTVCIQREGEEAEILISCFGIRCHVLITIDVRIRHVKKFSRKEIELRDIINSLS